MTTTTTSTTTSTSTYAPSREELADLQWRLELARSPQRGAARAGALQRRGTAVLAVVAGAVWTFDLAQLLLR